MLRRHVCGLIVLIGRLRWCWWRRPWTTRAPVRTCRCCRLSCVIVSPCDRLPAFWRRVPELNKGFFHGKRLRFVTSLSFLVLCGCVLLRDVLAALSKERLFRLCQLTRPGRRAVNVREDPPGPPRSQTRLEMRPDTSGFPSHDLIQRTPTRQR
jgi:hypothetical protein